MNVWRIHLNPDPKEGVDPRQFCFRKHILGVGWPLDSRVGKLEGEVGWEMYREGAKAKYGFGRSGGQWPSPLTALYSTMKVDDLVWTRERDGIYHLARVTGEWRYVDAQENVEADIVNLRACEWWQVGAEGEVPGGVSRAFIRGRALQRIADDTIAAFTKLLYNRRSKSVAYEVQPGEADLFSLLSPDACEDLVGLYLQVEEGYRIVPSTCKRTTPKYEFVMRHERTGKEAYVQVKSGRDPLPPESYASLPGKVFLFTAKGNYPGPRVPHVRCLNAAELLSFARANRILMPSKIDVWMEWANRHVGRGNAAGEEA